MIYYKDIGDVISLSEFDNNDHLNPLNKLYLKFANRKSFYSTLLNIDFDDSDNFTDIRNEILRKQNNILQTTDSTEYIIIDILFYPNKKDLSVLKSFLLHPKQIKKNISVSITKTHDDSDTILNHLLYGNYNNIKNRLVERYRTLESEKDRNLFNLISFYLLSREINENYKSFYIFFDRNQIFKALNPLLKIELWFELAQLLTKKVARNDLALSAYKRAFEEIKNSSINTQEGLYKQSALYNGVALIYFLDMNRNKAVEMEKEALKCIEEIGELNNRSLLLKYQTIFNLYLLYKKMNDTKHQENYLSLLKEINQIGGLGFDAAINFESSKFYKQLNNDNLSIYFFLLTDTNKGIVKEKDFLKFGINLINSIDDIKTKKELLLHIFTNVNGKYFIQLQNIRDYYNQLGNTSNATIAFFEEYLQKIELKRNIINEIESREIR